MIRVGLTGNIGTGKSTVARIFNILGVPVYNADKRSKDILFTHEVQDTLKSFFTGIATDIEGFIDRKALAEIVFNDAASLRILNSVLHPKVEHDFSVWCQLHREKAYIIQEAAILFESGFDRLFHKIILVTAPEEVCIQRVIERDKVNREQVLARMANQWPQQEKMKRADYIIENNPDIPLISQVLEIDKELRSH